MALATALRTDSITGTPSTRERRALSTSQTSLLRSYLARRPRPTTTAMPLSRTPISADRSARVAPRPAASGGRDLVSTGLAATRLGTGLFGMRTAGGLLDGGTGAYYLSQGRVLPGLIKTETGALTLADRFSGAKPTPVSPVFGYGATAASAGSLINRLAGGPPQLSAGLDLAGGLATTAGGIAAGGAAAGGSAAASAARAAPLASPLFAATLRAFSAASNSFFCAATWRAFSASASF